MRAKKVAILESRLGRQLADLVAQRGGVPFHAPALAELPDLDPEAIASLLRSLEERPGKAGVFPHRAGTRAALPPVRAASGQGCPSCFRAWSSPRAAPSRPRRCARAACASTAAPLIRS